MKKAEIYESDFLSDLLSEISSQEQEKTDKRMLLAARIDDAMKKKGWRKIDLAKEMKQQPSVITKWLSGTHNFNSDTLFDLEYHLEAKFINTEEKPREQTLHFHFNVSQKVTSDKYVDRVNDLNQTYPYAAWVGNNPVSC